MLTIISKLTIKTLWDFKLRFSKPTVYNCWENIHDAVSTLKTNNIKILQIMESLRLITLIRNLSFWHAVTFILPYHVLLVLYNQCTDVLLVDNMFNKDFSSLRTRMFGPGRGRTLSLPDIPASSAGPVSGSGSPFSGSHLNEVQLSRSSRCVSTPGINPEMEYSLGLLATATSTPRRSS
jgi:hypothetical protein